MNVHRQTPTAPSPATEVAAIWGSFLPIPAGSNANDEFEARVRRAWDHLRTAYFSVEEHERLREVLGKIIAREIANG